MKELWTEKYRSKTANEYVFVDKKQKNQVSQWIKSGSIPHLLFSGSPGTGKTTLAMVLINELDIHDYDVLRINASRENSVDDVRDKITTFVSTMPYGEFKVVFLDEADFFSPNGQAALRGVMEMYADTARFILTCNYPNKIIAAIHDRCQGFHVEKLDKVDFTERVAEILINENVKFNIELLDTYVKATYPSLRKCINSLQLNSINGELVNPSDNDEVQNDYMISAIELLKEGKISEARKLICSQCRVEEMDGVFRWMYDNLDLWADTDEGKDKAILVIRDGIVNHSLVADPEINLAATLIELTGVNNE